MSVISSLVSIGLPTYNGARYIERCLDSLLNQSYGNFELIISDNASIDNTQAICQRFASQDHRIKYIRRKSNMGGLENFRSLPYLAHGEYFMWAADDDWWYPDFVLKLKTILDAHPDYGLAMSSFAYGEAEYAFTGHYDLTSLNRYELFFHILTASRGRKTNAGSGGFNKETQRSGKYSINKDNMAIYGLFRRELLTKLLSRPLPYCMSSERVLLSEAAFLAKIYTVQDVLFKKSLLANERTGDRQSEEKKYFHSDKGFNRYLAMAFLRIFNSRNIKTREKLISLLFYYPKALYALRKFIMRDLKLTVKSAI